ncbi:hypothetical protein CKM354_000041700 [Cercospora kikuchii]|uniref:Uncharacterized protein n=1 Tax=Cercospora kikuchii TaxID=84275 RepID=A0A9P3C8X7_9PEZI|nr:uncharacterized protein CKM354_000041700 [Cercospora kikuchii]GIZ36952.1 hypothetical protein CKM354_000041700 [Cercospora kikuchii]
MADTRWRGWSSGIRWVLIAIFLVSTATWAMGCAFTARLANADIRNSPYYTRISTAELYFYAAGFPMATMLAAAVDIVLHMRGWLSPVVSIIWSLIAFALWTWVLVMWGTTEYSVDTGGFIDLYIYDDSLNVYAVDGSGLYYGRIALGSVAAILALVQLSFAARAVDLERKERKTRVGKLEGA